MTRQPLKCTGVGRDKDCISALQFYFSRRVTDDEMRFLHEVMQRSFACMPRLSDLVRRHDCPGHIASENDPKVCGRCGTHIDELRPPDEDWQ